MEESSSGPEPGLAAFEPELKKLQAAVSSLESGELALEDAFAQWEAGCASYAACRRILASAKARIEALAANFGSADPLWERFDAVERGEDGDAGAVASNGGGRDA